MRDQAEPPNVDIQNNLAITKDTYNRFQGNLYIQFSSIAVYGDIYDKTRSSFESPKPNTLYGYSKRAIEEYCRENSRSDKKICVLRLGNVFGDNLNWSDQIFQHCLEGQLKLPYNGSRSANCISITQLEKIISTVIEARAAIDDFLILNALNCPSLSWRALYDMHAAALGVPPLDSLADTQSEAIDRKMRAQLRRRPVLSACAEACSSIKILNFSRLANSYNFERSITLLLSKAPNALIRKAIAKGKSARGQATAKGPSELAESFLYKNPWLFSDQLDNDPALESLSQTDYSETQKEIDEFAKSYLPSFN